MCTVSVDERGSVNRRNYVPGHGLLSVGAVINLTVLVLMKWRERERERESERERERERGRERERKPYRLRH